MRPLVSFLIVATTATSCAVFDASMRQPETKEGVSNGSNEAGTGSSGQSPGTSSGAVDASPDAAVEEEFWSESTICAWAGFNTETGADGCNDAPGGFYIGNVEVESNSPPANAERLRKEEVGCGVAAGSPDVWEFPVSAGDCFFIDVDPGEDPEEARRARVEISGPGIPVGTSSSTRLRLPAKATASGLVQLRMSTVRKSKPYPKYKVLIR